MKFTIQSGDLENQAKVTLIIGVFEKGELPPASKRIDKKSGGFLSKILKNGDFSGKCGETFLLLNVPALKAQVLLVGCGANTTLNIRDYRKITAASIKTVQNASATHLISFLPELHVEKLDLPAKIKQAVQVCSNTLYRFEEYKSQKSPTLKIKEMTFSVADKKAFKAAQTALNQAISIADGMTLTKNLANTPSNICTPAYLADAAKKLAKRYRAITVKVLEEKDMKKLGMGAFLSVTKGSRQDAKLVALEYKGTRKKQAPVALVGKGITFDTGGISLKPSDAMIGMKYDMCGAATVLGTLQAVADLKLPIHVVGILAIAENMPGGNASKPEDIVKTMAGINVEILNTDAEGRLVLCDALTYTERYKPAAVIDIATLTGAVVVALGHHATGLLSNNDALAQELLDAGNETYDRAWPLPLWDEYQEQIRTPFADIANTGGKGAGTITAACFLSRFAKKFAWAHLDVAGTAAMMMGVDRYATGRPVPLLTQYLINRSEKKIK
jgi:leucyl aminopeptidase